MSKTIIKRVDGHGGVTVSDGWSFYVGKGFEHLPKVGDCIETIMVGGGDSGLGGEIRGVILNGVTLWEKSEEDVKAEHAAWLENYRREQEESKAKARADYAARLALDPMSFDWENAGPSPEAAAALSRVTDEAEFPQTYSGQTWRYAYRLWNAVNGDFDSVDSSGLGLSGFMAGWAQNAVRQMRGQIPQPNPAVVAVGAGEDQPLTPAVGSPESDLRRIFGA